MLWLTCVMARDIIDNKGLEKGLERWILVTLIHIIYYVVSNYTCNLWQVKNVFSVIIAPANERTNESFTPTYIFTLKIVYCTKFEI